MLNEAMRTFFTSRMMLLCLLVMTNTSLAEQQRPNALRLLPAETVLLLRTADAALLGQRLAESNQGRLLNDPELADVTASASEQISAFYNHRLQEVLGVELEQLRQLPAGEIALAMVERPGRQPAFALLVDFGEQIATAEQVLKRLYDRERQQGRTVVSEPLRSDEATLIRRGNNQNRVLAIVQREATLIAASDRELLQSMLDRWDQVPIEVADDNQPETPVALEQNQAFGAAMRECLPGREEPPQAIFYIDPIGILRAVGGQQGAVRLVMAMFPALGLDGVQAAAGAVWFSTDKWNVLLRGHLLLDNPRAGILKIARLEPGSSVPPPFVPANIENFAVLHADPQRMFGDIERLVDRIRTPGSLREQIENDLSAPLGVDFPTQVFANLAGHVYRLTGYDEGQTSLPSQLALAVQVQDPAMAKGVLAKIAQQHPAAMRPDQWGDWQYYTLGPAPNADQQGAENSTTARPPAAIGLVDDKVIIASSPTFLGQCLDAHAGVVDRYVDSLSYRLVTSRLKRFAKGVEPSLTLHQNTAPTIRHWHSLLSDGSLPQGGGRRAARFLLRLVQRAIGEQELPPLETLLRYAAPSGAVVYDTPSGLHLIGFEFKRGE